MSKVVVIFKVYPKEDMLGAAEASIRKEMNPQGMQQEEVAFGIKLLKVMFTFDDTQTSSSKLEERLRKLEGVGELEVAEETLL